MPIDRDNPGHADPRTDLGASPQPPTDSGSAPTPTEPGSAPTPTEPGSAPVPTEPGSAPVPTEPGSAPTPTEPGSAPTPTEPGSAPVPTEPGSAPSPATGGRWFSRAAALATVASSAITAVLVVVYIAWEALPELMTQMKTTLKESREATSFWEEQNDTLRKRFSQDFSALMEAQSRVLDHFEQNKDQAEQQVESRLLALRNQEAYRNAVDLLDPLYRLVFGQEEIHEFSPSFGDVSSIVFLGSYVDGIVEFRKALRERQEDDAGRVDREYSYGLDDLAERHLFGAIKSNLLLLGSDQIDELQKQRIRRSVDDQLNAYQQKFVIRLKDETLPASSSETGGQPAPSSSAEPPYIGVLTRQEYPRELSDPHNRRVYEAKLCACYYFYLTAREFYYSDEFNSAQRYLNIARRYDPSRLRPEWARHWFVDVEYLELIMIEYEIGRSRSLEAAAEIAKKIQIPLETIQTRIEAEPDSMRIQNLYAVHSMMEWAMYTRNGGIRSKEEFESLKSLFDKVMENVESKNPVSGLPGVMRVHALSSELIYRAYLDRKQDPLLQQMKSVIESIDPKSLRLRAAQSYCTVEHDLIKRVVLLRQEFPHAGTPDANAGARAALDAAERSIQMDAQRLAVQNSGYPAAVFLRVLQDLKTAKSRGWGELAGSRKPAD